jgi:hypothetical protein
MIAKEFIDGYTVIPYMLLETLSDMRNLHILHRNAYLFLNASAIASNAICLT